MNSGICGVCGMICLSQPRCMGCREKVLFVMVLFSGQNPQLAEYFATGAVLNGPFFLLLHLLGELICCVQDHISILCEE